MPRIFFATPTAPADQFVDFAATNPSYTPPPGASLFTLIETFGGGGGGAGGIIGSSGGGGGGGGYAAEYNVPIVAGFVYAATVGLGGAGGFDGASSSFGCVTEGQETIYAEASGGFAGFIGDPPIGGGGGSGATGTLLVNGGSGGTGDLLTFGGGGGGGAGPAGTGDDGSGQTGGVGQEGPAQGTGGDGGDDGAPGNAGGGWGGGGGGGGEGDGTSAGPGGPGRVHVIVAFGQQTLVLFDRGSNIVLFALEQGTQLEEDSTDQLEQGGIEAQLEETLGLTLADFGIALPPTDEPYQLRGFTVDTESDRAMALYIVNAETGEHALLDQWYTQHYEYSGPTLSVPVGWVPTIRTPIGLGGALGTVAGHVDWERRGIVYPGKVPA